MSKARGHITKRNNGWCYRFSYLDSNGNLRWKSAQGFKTKADAQRCEPPWHESLDNT